MQNNPTKGPNGAFYEKSCTFIFFTLVGKANGPNNIEVKLEGDHATDAAKDNEKTIDLQEEYAPDDGSAQKGGRSTRRRGRVTKF